MAIVLKMKKALVWVFLIGVIASSFRKEGQTDKLLPSNFPKPNRNFKKHPLNPAKVLLGRALFYDPILSGDSTVSCSSCHTQYSAFTHADHALSHGVEGKIGNRNSPALMNLAWGKTFMWDGVAHTLQDQAKLPITNPLEMGENLPQVLLKLQRSQLYPKLFYMAFSDSTIAVDNLVEAIAQFSSTIVSCNSRYDSMVRGQVVFTGQENNGYRLFKKDCSSCHTEPLFTNQGFENNGLPMDTSLKDLGRMGITNNPKDSLKFKVPTLRNLEYSYPYMHDGRFKRLYDVLKHYTNGIQKIPTLAKQLQTPILLTPNERVDLVAFLLTLSDKSFVKDTNYAYPKNLFLKTAKE